MKEMILRLVSHELHYIDTCMCVLVKCHIHMVKLVTLFWWFNFVSGYCQIKHTPYSGLYLVVLQTLHCQIKVFVGAWPQGSYEKLKG